MTPKLKFIDKDGSSFFAKVKQRVDEHFVLNGISKTANAAMIGKTIFYLSSAIILFACIISNFFPPFVQLIMAVGLGMNMTFIGFNICHDALHGAYSSNKKVNKALGFIFNIIGANSYVWGITHNIVHHTYTNIPGHDEDIEIAPGLIRISSEEKYLRHQKYQHIYAFFLYSLASLSWFFRKDYLKFFQKEVGNHQNNHPKIEYFNLFFYKLIYYTIFIVIPFIVLALPWWQILIGYIAMNLAMGLTMGLIFQLAHVVEATSFPLPDDTGNIPEAWAIHQMRTTANFASQSWFANFFCGGLNLQIEHHLFSKICHIHYPAVSKIVKKTALEYGLPYNENTSFLSALKSHYLILKKLGSNQTSVAPA